MAKKNPEWSKAETARLSAEKAYKEFMSSQKALDMREEDRDAYQAKVNELNEAIEAANKKVRTTREFI